MKGHRSSYIQLPEAEIAELYLDGWPLAALSVCYGVSERTISDRLRGRGVKLRPAHAPEKRLPDAKIADLYRNGMSTVDIAGFFNVSATLIRERLRRQNVKWRKPVRATETLKLPEKPS